MLKLPIPSKELKQEYVNHFLPGLVSRVKNGYSKTVNGKIEHYELKPSAKEILLPDWDKPKPNTNRLKRLLISEPIALKKLNDALTQELDALIPAKKPNKQLLRKIFGYELIFNNSSKNESYWLAQKIGRNTCTYCNRIYNFTVIKDGGTNSENRIVRPEFDHWFDKSDYPLMSLSLCNLIPSCPLCNSSIKGSVKFDLSTHIHPYIHEAGHPDITFRASLATVTPPKWTVEIDTPKGSKEEKMVKDMKLNEVYAYHGELEVKDLMNFNDAYPSGYLKQLLDDVLKGSKRKLNKHDVYRMLFGAEIDSSRHLDRPLSKMKYDILHAMGVI